MKFQATKRTAQCILSSGGECVCFAVRTSAAFPAQPFQPFAMPKTDDWNYRVRWLKKYAYSPGSNPRRPLPGPLYDLVVLGLFLFLGLGLLVARSDHHGDIHG